MTRYSARLFTLICISAIAAAPLRADTVETKNGSRIVGKVLKIDEGAVAVETEYAGTLAIKQSEVTAITTDAPISVRLASGTRIDGQVTAPSAGTLRIDGVEGTITTPVADVAASWTVGDKDPQILALERHWAYEAAVDVAGKTGNGEQLGTAVSLRAVLKTLVDTLQFYSAYDRQVTDGTKSADEFQAGVDYQNNFAGRLSWYARDEGGFDRVKDIELYNVAAAGFGYDFVKQPKHVLTGRAGLSFRYEGYRNPMTEDVKSAGFDFGIVNEMTFENAKLVNRISYVPSFEDFANYRLTHESYFEMPLAVPSWKLRVGVNNDYNSQPGAGVEKLDTAYFTRLVLSWR